MRVKTYIIFIVINKSLEKQFIEILKNIKNITKQEELNFNIHWSWPIYFFELINKNEELLLWWIERLQNGDFFIPQTYSGLPHEFLLKEEIHVDLYWALNNPWKYGYKNLFKNPPSLFYINGMEKQRKNVLELYNKVGFNYIEGKRVSEDLREYITYYMNGIQYVYELSENLDFKNSNFTTALFWLELDNVWSKEMINDFLLMLRGIERELFSIKFENIEKIKIKTKLIESPKYNSLREKMNILNFQKNRLKYYEVNQENLKAFLLERFDKREENFESPKRSLEFNMEGNFTIPHKKYSLNFTDGVLSKVKYIGRQVEVMNSIKSYIKVKSKKENIKLLEISSSFSFNDGKILGIRQYKTFNNLDIAIFDYFIDEEIDSFFISGRVEWNKAILDEREEEHNLKEIEEFSPLEIPLFEVEKNSIIRISATYPDKDKYEKIIDCKRDERGFLNGSSFIIINNNTGGGFFIKFLYIDKPIVHTLNFKIDKINKKNWFFINIEGSYNRVERIEVLGYVQTFNVMILPILNNFFDNSKKLNTKIKNTLLTNVIKKI